MACINALKPVSAAVAISLASLSTSALADILEPGASISLGGTTVTASPWLQGVSPGGTTRSFTITGPGGAVVFSGTLLVSFVDSVPFGRRFSNYRVQSTSGVAGRIISKIEFGGFGTSPIDVEYRTDFAPALAPNAAFRNAEGDTVTFQFAGLPAGVTSQFFYIFTGAPTVANTGTARIVLNTGESATVTGLPVPAPLVACEGDTNGDGVINFTDLNGVLTNFGEDCP
jgi:hypothetical protein